MAEVGGQASAAPLPAAFGALAAADAGLPVARGAAPRRNGLGIGSHVSAKATLFRLQWAQQTYAAEARRAKVFGTIIANPGKHSWLVKWLDGSELVANSRQLQRVDELPTDDGSGAPDDPDVDDFGDNSDDGDLEVSSAEDDDDEADLLLSESSDDEADPGDKVAATKVAADIGITLDDDGKLVLPPPGHKVVWQLSLLPSCSSDFSNTSTSTNPPHASHAQEAIPGGRAEEHGVRPNRDHTPPRNPRGQGGRHTK